MRIEKYRESDNKLGVIPLQERTKYQSMGTVEVSMLCNFEIKVGACWSQFAVVQLKWYSVNNV
jgi:hypothetical protein